MCSGWFGTNKQHIETKSQYCKSIIELLIKMKLIKCLFFIRYFLLFKNKYLKNFYFFFIADLRFLFSGTLSNTDFGLAIETKEFLRPKTLRPKSRSKPARPRPRSRLRQTGLRAGIETKTNLETYTPNKYKNYYRVI